MLQPSQLYKYCALRYLQEKHFNPTITFVVAAPKKLKIFARKIVFKIGFQMMPYTQISTLKYNFLIQIGIWQDVSHNGEGSSAQV